MKKYIFLVFVSLVFFILSSSKAYAFDTNLFTQELEGSMYDANELQVKDSTILINQITDEVVKSLNLQSRTGSNSQAVILNTLEKENYDRLSSVEDLSEEYRLILAKVIAYRYQEALTNSEISTNMLKKIHNSNQNVGLYNRYTIDIRVAAYYIENIKTAKAIYADYQYFINTLPFPQNVGVAEGYRNSIFISLVKTGSPWDLKQYLGLNNSYLLLDYTRTGEYIGNHHFGYMGYHCGFALTYLRVGAGLYQIVSGTSDWAFMSNYFDDPRDAQAIQDGYYDSSINFEEQIFIIY